MHVICFSRSRIWLVILLMMTGVFGESLGQTEHEFPFQARLLDEKFDLPNTMMKGVGDFLDQALQESKATRNDFWQRDFTSPAAFNQSIASQRQELQQILGLIDERSIPFMSYQESGVLEPYTFENEKYTISAVKWRVFDGVFGDFYAEGLLISPKGETKARVVYVPDAATSPEVVAGMTGEGEPGFGRAAHMARNDVEVLVPVLLNRKDTYSGSTIQGKFTNQTHREYIYRQGFILGRHVIGYELQKVLAAVDWFQAKNEQMGKPLKIGVAGHGEGGMLSLFAAALDPRISASLVSGYFDQREDIWNEPIYRNVFGLLKKFGDAELAVMSWPQKLNIEDSLYPEASGPPAPSAGRTGAAPGVLSIPELSSVKAEWQRAEAMLPKGKSNLRFFEGRNALGNGEQSDKSLSVFLKDLGIEAELNEKNISLLSSGLPSHWLNVEHRQERAVRAMENHMQQLIPASETIRDNTFWQTLDSKSGDLKAIKSAHRARLWEELGKLPDPNVPNNTEARFYAETEGWTAYEVKLDVWEGVFAWGILLVPKGVDLTMPLPAVVTQHGLEGLPKDVLTKDKTERAYKPYKGFASDLADRGYVVFAPHNLYWGKDNFRVLQRKANPLGLSLYSIITGQHQRIVDWLGQQDFVDLERIAFYGLSYGGKTAMRVPALVEGYALSICSGDFNEWVRKVASTDYEAFNSYPFTGEYEIPEWNLANTFNYAEMAALIAPRPFMVERGHKDAVGTDKWVAYEYAKVRRHYANIQQEGATTIAYFNDGHTINGIESFAFLDKFLKNAK
ncbi:alpha/beta hydrolase family protein [Cyclobacterium amurskyense]|uniref:Putative secreted protein n=1 Tax=Cyclobacterium amurskyense TaxID=320787 RepID=A0A0H4P8Z1_9BACT|nr:alpha/beta hydrolase family protein [Cyclobacterium amurskyense]AKP49595.1 Putative secreted protein [Cyclobacterium amurskyense]